MFYRALEQVRALSDDRAGTVPTDRYTIYGTSWCPHCVRAKEMCETNKLPYEFVDIEASPARPLGMQEMTRVPQIFVTRYVGGSTQLAAMLPSDERAGRA